MCGWRKSAVDIVLHVTDKSEGKKEAARDETDGREPAWAGSKVDHQGCAEGGGCAVFGGQG